MKTVKVSREARKALDSAFKSAIESCENTYSFKEFLERCDDASIKIEISEEPDVVLAEEV